jgi:hypothetical protein
MAKSKTRSNHSTKVAQRNLKLQHAEQKRNKVIAKAYEKFQEQNEYNKKVDREVRLERLAELLESDSQSKMLEVSATEGVIISEK